MSQKDLFEEETINGIPIVDVESQNLFDLADEDLPRLLAQFEALPTQSANGAILHLDGSGRTSTVVPPERPPSPSTTQSSWYPTASKVAKTIPPLPFSTPDPGPTPLKCVSKPNSLTRHHNTLVRTGLLEGPPKVEMTSRQLMRLQYLLGWMRRLSHQIQGFPFMELHHLLRLMAQSVTVAFSPDGQDSLQ